MSNTITWFEIPAADLTRAAKFYEAIFEISLKASPDGSMVFASTGTTGCLMKRPDLVPGASGPRIYLNTSGQMDAVLARVPKAGGKVVLPKTAIPPNGVMAMIIDSEGNSIGLHQAD